MIENIKPYRGTGALIVNKHQAKMMGFSEKTIERAAEDHYGLLKQKDMPEAYLAKPLEFMTNKVPILGNPNRAERRRKKV